MNEKPTFTVIGDVGIDLVVGPIESWPQIGTETVVDKNELRAGGSAGNSALAAYYLGGPCRLISMVGNDDFGGWLKGQFDSIDAPLPVCDAPTSLTVGIIHACGERTFLTTKGHLEDLELPDLREGFEDQAVPGSIALLAGVFLTPRIRLRYDELIGCLQARGYQVAIDTGWPPSGWTADLRREVLSWLKECDHILLNETEIIHLMEEEDLEKAVAKLSSIIKPSACLVAKIGPKGALAVSNGEKTNCRAREADVFDTIGAGDSFNTGYILSRLQGDSLTDAILAGCNAAALIISRFPRKEIKAGEFSRPPNIFAQATMNGRGNTDGDSNGPFLQA